MQRHRGEQRLNGVAPAAHAERLGDGRDDQSAGPGAGRGRRTRPRPGSSADARVATSIASRVLPTPPGPVRVTSRTSSRRSRAVTSASSRSRPISDVSGRGKDPVGVARLKSSSAIALPTCVSTVRGSANCRAHRVRAGLGQRGSGHGQARSGSRRRVPDGLAGDGDGLLCVSAWPADRAFKPVISEGVAESGDNPVVVGTVRLIDLGTDRSANCRGGASRLSPAGLAAGRRDVCQVGELDGDPYRSSRSRRSVRASRRCARRVPLAPLIGERAQRPGVIAVPAQTRPRDKRSAPPPQSVLARSGCPALAGPVGEVVEHAAGPPCRAERPERGEAASRGGSIDRDRREPGDGHPGRTEPCQAEWVRECVVECELSSSRASAVCSPPGS